MNVTSQGFNTLSGYYSQEGVAKPRGSSEPASFLIHYTKPSTTLCSVVLTLSKSISFVE